jgi:hypothetical protein
MQVCLQNIKHITFAIARLHNLVIDKRLLNSDGIEDVGTGADKIYNDSNPDEGYVAEQIV